MPSWLQTLLLVLAVACSSIVLFGAAGCVVLLIVLAVAAILYKLEGPTAVLLLLFLGLIGLVYLLLPGIESARGASTRMHCFDNLKQISLAIMNYEIQYHSLPPAYVADKHGKPMHSWRVLILPFLECQDLYEQYDFDEPWDGPNNRKLLAYRPRVFACPGDADARQNDDTTTSYVAVVGKKAFWPPDKPRSLDDANLQGHFGDTVTLIEVANSGINWTEPRDFSLDESAAEGQPPSRLRRSIGHVSLSAPFLYRAATTVTSWGGNISFADGHQEFVSAAAIASQKLNDWLTVGGFNHDEVDSPPPGRQIDILPQHFGPRINWPHCIALPVWIVSVLLLFYRAWRSRIRDGATQR